MWLFETGWLFKHPQFKFWSPEAPAVASWLLPRFFMEDLLVDCVTGMCCSGFGLVNGMKPVKRFGEPDHVAWLLLGLTSLHRVPNCDPCTSLVLVPGWCPAAWSGLSVRQAAAREPALLILIWGLGMTCPF